MGVTNPGLPAVQEVMANEKEHRRQIAWTVNQIQSGRMRATLDFTLTANQSSSTVIDSRIGYYSAIRWMPLTARAAAEAATGNMSIPQATLLKGSAVINHTNATTTDRTFRLVIISP